MRYFIMRHGASESNVSGKVQGILDVPLAPLGYQQAQQTRDHLLAHEKITHVFASPLLRASETARVVAEGFGLEVVHSDALQARDLGEWAGYPRAEIKRMWADPEHPFRKDPHFAPPGGESLHAVEQRLYEGMDHMLASLEASSEKEVLPLFVMHLISTGALTYRLNGQRPSLKNAEVWSLDTITKEARSLFVPDGEMLPGLE